MSLTIFGGIFRRIPFFIYPCTPVDLSFCKKCTSAKVQKLVNRYLACVELYCEVDIKDVFIGVLYC